MAEYQGLSFEFLDQILDIAEQPLQTLNERYELSATLERWHWDEPEITLAWTEAGPYYVSKNVRFFMRITYVGSHPGADTQHLLFATEANAWLDEDSETGEERIRRWEHRPFWVRGYPTQLIREERPEIEGEIDSAIHGTYEVAESLSLADLSRTYYYRRTEQEGG